MTAADPLELATRRRLYQHIVAHPGKYLRELQRDAGFAMGSLEYHLNALVDSGLITVLQDGNKRFFPQQVDHRDRPVLAMLRQELPRRVLLVALAQPICSKSMLISELRVPPSTLNYHLGHLVKLGLLASQREGRDAVYLVPDREVVLRLLVAYRATLLDRLVDAFLDGTGALR